MSSTIKLQKKPLPKSEPLYSFRLPATPRNESRSLDPLDHAAGAGTVATPEGSFRPTLLTAHPVARSFSFPCIRWDLCRFLMITTGIFKMKS